MTWNVLNGSILAKPDLYTRMLEALDELAAEGVRIVDTPDGTRWTRD